MESFGVGTQTTFVNCEITNNHLISFATNLACLYVRAFLEEKGLKTAQFIQDNPPNIYDLVDDILSLVDDIVVFYVDTLNYFAVRVITHEIKKSAPEKRVIYFGSLITDQFEYILSSTQVDICVLSNPEKNIYELLRSDPENWPIQHGVALKRDGKIVSKHDGTVTDHLPSPYISRIVPADRAQRFGILISRNCGFGSGYYCSMNAVQNDLEFIRNAVTQKEMCVPLIAENVTSYPKFYDFLLLLKNYPFTYQSCINISCLTDELIDRLADTSFVKIKIIIDNYKYFSENLKW